MPGVNIALTISFASRTIRHPLHRTPCLVVPGVGFSAASVQLSRLPGWDAGSYGYHGDDGNRFAANGRGTKYGPKYGTGDVVGALWNR